VPREDESVNDKRRFALPDLGRIAAGAVLAIGIAAGTLSHRVPANGDAGVDAGMRSMHAAAWMAGVPVHHAFALPTKAGASDEIDALTGLVRDWGLRRVAVCRARAGAGESRPAASTYAVALRCAGPKDGIAADARAIAATHAQAVIYSGTTEDAAAFVTALRRERSYAMVVLASSVDRDRLAALLPAEVRRWVLVAGHRAPQGSDDAGTLTVAMLASSSRHAH
jgi:hypothetical protein